LKLASPGIGLDIDLRIFLRINDLLSVEITAQAVRRPAGPHWRWLRHVTLPVDPSHPDLATQD